MLFEMDIVILLVVFTLIHPQSTPGSIKHLSLKGEESQDGLDWKDLRDHPIPPWFTSPGPQNRPGRIWVWHWALWQSDTGAGQSSGHREGD